MFPQLNRPPSNLSQLVNSIASSVLTSGKFSKFQHMYMNDRIAFAHDIFGELGRGVTKYQDEIFGTFDDGYTRLAVRAPHGTGKSFTAAVLTHHGVLTAIEDAKVITTASAWRQVEHYLWPEIRKVGAFIDWNEVGREPYNTRTEYFQLKIVLRNVEAFAVVSDDPATIEGAHARYMLYILDEAKSIIRATWDAVEGAFANATPGKQRNIVIPVNKEDDEIEAVFERVLDGEDPVRDYGREVIDVTNIFGSRDEDEFTEVEHHPGEFKKSISDALREAFDKQSNRSLLGNNVEASNNALMKPSMDLAARAHSVVDGQFTRTPSNLGDPTYPGDPTNPNNRANTGDTQQSWDPNNTQVNNLMDYDDVKLPIPKNQRIPLDPQSSTPNPRNPIIQVNDRNPSIRANTVEPSNPMPSNKIDKALAFAISTPGNPSGQFYDICMHKPGYEDWQTKHITVDEAINAGRINPDWVEQNKRRWGEKSSVFQNRVLGEFADESEDGIIPLSWIRSAVERWKFSGLCK